MTAVLALLGVVVALLLLILHHLVTVNRNVIATAKIAGARRRA